MAVKALSPDKERCYVLKADRKNDPDEQTRFYYKILSAERYYQSQDRLVEFRGGNEKGKDDQRTVVLSGSQERTILLSGLIRVENLKDEDGKELQVPEKQADKLQFLSWLRPKDRRELANAILGDSDMTDEEVENLDSPSPSI